MPPRTDDLMRSRFRSVVDRIRKAEEFIPTVQEHPRLLVMRDKGMTLLHHAIASGNPGAVNELLALPNMHEAISDRVNAYEGVDPEWVGKDSVHLAEHLARQYSQTQERASFGAIYDILVAERDGQNAFMNAVCGFPGYTDSAEDLKRRKDVIDRTLERHPDFIDTAENGMRPLCLAAWKGQTGIVVHLLDKGANPTLTNEAGVFKGMTARQITERERTHARGSGAAVSARYPEIIPILEGAETSWTQTHGEAPTRHAASIDARRAPQGGGRTR